MNRHVAGFFRWARVLIAAGLVCGTFWSGHANEATTDVWPTEVTHYLQAPSLSTGDWSHQELAIVNDPYRLAVAGTWLDEPLAVQGAPNSAITFAALDSGRFANRQTSIVVRADGRGVAAARFFVSRPGEYRVLATSQNDVGPAQFDIRAVSRQFRDDVVTGRYAQHYLETHAAAAKRRQQQTAGSESPQPAQAPPRQD